MCQWSCELKLQNSPKNVQRFQLDIHVNLDFHSQSEHIYIIGYTKNSRPKLLFGFFNLKTKSSVICCILSCTCMPIAFDNDLVYSECHSQTVLRNIPRMRNPERFTLIKDRWDADFFCNHILILQRLRFMLHIVQ